MREFAGPNSLTDRYLPVAAMSVLCLLPGQLGYEGRGFGNEEIGLGGLLWVACLILSILWFIFPSTRLVGISGIISTVLVTPFVFGLITKDVSRDGQSIKASTAIAKQQEVFEMTVIEPPQRINVADRVWGVLAYEDDGKIPRLVYVECSDARGNPTLKPGDHFTARGSYFPRADGRVTQHFQLWVRSVSSGCQP